MKCVSMMLVAVSILGASLTCSVSARAGDSEEIFKRLALLERENAALRERVRRLETQRTFNQNSPAGLTGKESKIKIDGGVPRDAFATTDRAAARSSVSLVNWTGFYLGGHAGWGWNTTTVDDPFFIIAPSFLQGPEVRDVNGSGQFWGLQAGGNYQVGNLVVGVEANLSTANMKGSRVDSLSATPTFNPDTPFASTTNASDTRTWRNNVDWVGTATMRLGYTWDRWLVYTKGGIAASRNTYSLFDVNSSASTQTGLPTVFFTQTTSTTGADTRIGWTVGAGIEWILWKNWSAAVEYNYLNFGDRLVTMSGTMTGVGSLTGSFSSPTTSIKRVDQTIQTMRLGVNYHFSPTQLP